MRILVDYRPALRTRTGVGEYMRQLVGAYTASYDDEVALFTSSWKDRPAVSTGAELRATVIDRRVPVAALNYLWHRLEWPPVELLAGPVDVVQSAHPLLIPSRRGAQVVTIHDLFFLDHPHQVRNEIRRDYPALTRAHAHRADAIVAPSEYTKGVVVERLGVGADRVYVCPPTAPAWKTLGRAPNVPAGGYMLMLGTMEPRKNIGIVLDTFEWLSDLMWAPRLVIAGRATPEAAEWLARIAKPPLNRCIEYRGYVPDEEREKLFAGARALLLPSVDEGFGLPALEAMSAGVAVVAAERGALPEVVGSGGVLVPPDDVHVWADVIGRLARQDDMVCALASAGLERARTFTAERTAARLGQAYRDAVGRRDARARA